MRSSLLALVLAAAAACAARGQDPGSQAADIPGVLVVNAHLPRARDAADPRDAFRRPDELVALLALRRGEHVADVGAGDGYLTHRLAAAVGPGGRVVATDVDPRALLRLVRRTALARQCTTPIDTRVVAADAPGLEPAAFDLILLAEVDQYLPERVAYFRELVPALAPGGRLVVANRAPYHDDVLAAASRAGLVVRSESHTLPGQFVVTLVAPATPASSEPSPAKESP